jgi:hypothetical protein
MLIFFHFQIEPIFLKKKKGDTTIQKYIIKVIEIWNDHQAKKAIVLRDIGISKLCKLIIVNMARLFSPFENQSTNIF